MYVLSESNAKTGVPVVQLMGSGTILRQVIAGAELLKNDFGRSSFLRGRPLLRRRGGIEGARRREGATPQESDRGVKKYDLDPEKADATTV
jgi:pyruvate dehydrogenase complex dehydrogenase (E1) component